MAKRYGLISIVSGGLAIFTLTFLAGIASIITAFLGMRSVPEKSEKETDRKGLYFCIIGLLLTIFAFWLHSYVL